MRRKKGQSGATLVETALTLLPMIMLLAGTFDVAIAMLIRATFVHAAREGARFAITYQLKPPLTTHDASIKKVVKENGMGFLRDSNITISYYDGKNPGTLIPFPNGNLPDNIVVVDIDQFSWTWITPMAMGSRTPFVIKASSADKMESLPQGQNPPPR